MNKSIFHFGEFHLEVSARLLARKGQRVPLGSKAFEVLTCLVMHAGEVVTKDLLLKTVWPNSFVEENNLTQHIFSLRKALADRADYIVTIPGRGYQFTGTVLEIVPAIPKPQAPVPVEVAAMPEVLTVVVDAVPIAIVEPVAVEVPVMDPAKLMPEVWSRPPRFADRAIWWSLMVLAVVTLLAWGGWMRLRMAKAGDHCEVVLADFNNRTGDGTFDRTLQRALAIDLEQSPFVDVMGGGETAVALQRMGRKSGEAMTQETAMEICARSKRQVVLMGSIASMGQEYLLTLEGTDCRSGKDVAGAKAEVASKENVPGALDAIVDRVRAGLGEPAQSVASHPSR